MSSSLYTYCDDFRLYNFLSLRITIQIAIMLIFIKLYCGNPEIRNFQKEQIALFLHHFQTVRKKILTKILRFRKNES